MKYTKYILVALAIIFMVPSCDQGFAELNQDPGAAAEINPAFQLSWVQLRSSGGRYENWRAMLIYSATMMQHMSAVCGYWTGDKYTYNSGYSSSLWDSAYPNEIKNVTDLINTLSNNEGTAQQLAIANIWRVVIFQRVTDMYGDTPYSEAGKGFIDGIIQPKYDSQEDIYADMIDQLKTAASALGSGNTFGDADFVYGGDEAQWKRFANSMLLRLAMRLVKVDPGRAQSLASEAIAAGLMQSTDDAFIAHAAGPDGINRNGIGEVLDKANGFGDDCPRISANFMSMLEGDPRQAIIAAPAENNGELKGMPNGLDATTLGQNPTGTTTNDFSRVNPELVRVSSPMFFMTYAESEFLRAEAIVRGWASGDAAEAYANGVRGAMKLFDHYPTAAKVADADIDAYLAANPFDEANAMEQLGKEFYIATFLNEYEAFSNWRRTGYPELTPINYPGNEAGGQIPRRLRYSGGEFANNPDGIAGAIANQGPDQFTTRVWWDVN